MFRDVLGAGGNSDVESQPKNCSRLSLIKDDYTTADSLTAVTAADSFTAVHCGNMDNISLISSNPLNPDIGKAYHHNFIKIIILKNRIV